MPSTLILAVLAASVPLAAPGRPNVLFIAVDDLRPQLGCYGDRVVKSPNIDRLAAGGVLFERAYCQQAICMSSRASLLSGYRPDRGRIYENGPLYKHVPDAWSLNRHFQSQGYETVTIGKIYHHASDEQIGWSVPAIHPKGSWTGWGYLTAEAQRLVKEGRTGRGPPCESADVADAAYPDGAALAAALEQLERLQRSKRPFFLAVGFLKPHLPFNAPKRYWDLYPSESIRLADQTRPPKNAPDCAVTNWDELRKYHGVPKKGPLAPELARQLIHGYYACVSYTDALVGRLLDRLRSLGLEGNTVVVLWGDNGWKLGEYGLWSKHTNFELDTHVPLVIRAPGRAPARTRALVEFVDIYPTLCELCGLSLPKHLEGTSLVPLLAQPDRAWKRAAFSQYPRPGLMGYCVRTDRYRYTEWRKTAGDEVFARELYDFQSNPQPIANLAGDPQHATAVAEMAGILRAGWQASRPEKR